jgi:hypothetical protein
MKVKKFTVSFLCQDSVTADKVRRAVSGIPGVDTDCPVLVSEATCNSKECRANHGKRNSGEEG